MTMNAVNTGVWAGIYGAGFMGTGKVFGAAFDAVKATANWVWDSASAREVQALPQTSYKASLKDLLDGAKWIAAALVVRQVVSHFWSPVPSAGVLKALSVFGWKPVRSPLIDTVADKINSLAGLKLTIY